MTVIMVIITTTITAQTMMTMKMTIVTMTQISEILCCLSDNDASVY